MNLQEIIQNKPVLTVDKNNQKLEQLAENNSSENASQETELKSTQELQLLALELLEKAANEKMQQAAEKEEAKTKEKETNAKKEEVFTTPPATIKSFKSPNEKREKQEKLQSSSLKIKLLKKSYAPKSSPEPLHVKPPLMVKPESAMDEKGAEKGNKVETFKEKVDKETIVVDLDNEKGIVKLSDKLSSPERSHLQRKEQLVKKEFQDSLSVLLYRLSKSRLHLI